MEDYLKWINLGSNIVLSGAFGAFMVFLFGRENSMVYTLKPYKTLLLKLGISMCAAGSLFSALTMPKPTPSEALMDLGMAMVFSWAAWFHYHQFIKDKCCKVKKPLMKVAKKKQYK